MKGIRVEDDYSLTWADAPDPELRPGHVVIDVMASAVNRADLLQRRGRYPVPAGASPIMGLEASGVIAEVADDVEDWAVGDRVCALLSGGGYAQKALVPAAHLLRMHEGMTFEEAAAIPEVFLTAFLNLYIEGSASSGETLMVHAAASGVGTAALQLAALFDNPIIGTASGAKLDQLERWSPLRTIDRHTEDFAEVVAEVTDGRGVDVILDPVGRDYFERNIASLAPQGRLVSIGLLSGTNAEIDLGPILRKRLRIIGSVLRPRTDDEKTAIISRFRSDAWPFFVAEDGGDAGRLEPVIDTVFPIAQTEEAHQLVADNATVGKVILEVNSSRGG